MYNPHSKIVSPRHFFFHDPQPKPEKYDFYVVGSRVAQWYSVGLVIQGCLIRAALYPVCVGGGGGEECPWARHFRAPACTCETQERHEQC